jgi:hypothetical protein
MCDFGFKTPFQGLQFLLGQSHVMFWSSAHACNELGVKCVLPEMYILSTFLKEQG